MNLTISLYEKRELGGICHTSQSGLAQLGLTWIGLECGELLGTAQKQRKCGERTPLLFTVHEV